MIPREAGRVKGPTKLLIMAGRLPLLRKARKLPLGDQSRRALLPSGTCSDLRCRILGIEAVRPHILARLASLAYETDLQYSCSSFPRYLTVYESRDLFS